MILKTLEDLNTLSQLTNPPIIIEDLIEQSTNPFMLLDKIHRCMKIYINSSQYGTEVHRSDLIHLLEKRIDGYSYESVVQEVMSLFEH